MKKTKRKVYKAPKLKKYGDFRKLTLTKGALNGDGNNKPKCRSGLGGGG